MENPVIQYLIFFLTTSLAGWIFLWSGLSSLRSQRRREEAERSMATGTILEYHEKTFRAYRQPTRRLHLPVIEFSAGGTLYRLEYDNSMSPEAYPVGKSVDLFYDSSDPAHFHLADDQAFQKGAGNMIRVGLIWVAVCFAAGFVIISVRDGQPLRSPENQGIFHGNARSTETPVPVSPEGDFEYVLQEDGTVRLTKYLGSDSSLFLPVSIDGHLVTDIASNTFTQAGSLQSVTVPGTLGTVSPGAFSGCMSLREVILLDGLRGIGSAAFALCLSLKDVTIPASVTFFADSAFPDDCSAAFHVKSGSKAEEYCRKNGFSCVTDP